MSRADRFVSMFDQGYPFCTRASPALYVVMSCAVVWSVLMFPVLWHTSLYILFTHCRNLPVVMNGKLSCLLVTYISGLKVCSRSKHEAMFITVINQMQGTNFDCSYKDVHYSMTVNLILIFMSSISFTYDFKIKYRQLKIQAGLHFLKRDQGL